VDRQQAWASLQLDDQALCDQEVEPRLTDCDAFVRNSDGHLPGEANCSEPEFDAQLATPGLHTVKAKVQFTPRRTVLPPDLFEKYAGLAFWRDPAGSAAWRITAQPQDQPAG